MAGPEKISIIEFAKLIGVDPSSVYRAIDGGRLKKSVTKLPTGYSIDPEVGAQEFRDNRRREPRNKSVPSGEPILELERQQKFYQTELARLKFEKESGSLLSADDIRRQAFIIARTVRDAMLAIPSKVAAELAGEKDAFMVSKRLDEEIRQALENLSATIAEQRDEESDE